MERASNRHEAPRCTTTYKLRNGASFTTQHAYMTGDESYRVAKKLNERVAAKSGTSVAAIRARMVEDLRRRGIKP
jgi:hypothetical protein